MKNHTLIIALFLSAFITACGGGGDTGATTVRVAADSPATPIVIPSGIFSCPSLATSNVGINQSTPNYYTAQIVFADLMKHSAGWRRPFFPVSPYLSTPLQLDADGYPTVIDLDDSFVNIIHGDQWGRDVNNDNTYVLLYDGEGTFSLNIKHTILNQSSGRIVYQINEKRRTILTLNSTNPNNHARNIRFVAQSDEATYATQPFRQDFLATWGGFPVTRYMDWLQTNHSTVVEWSDRTLPTNMMQSFGAGVAYEYIIQLSNLTKTNPWINIPHLASDNYVTQLATLFKNTLDPNLTVYIEYTNEAWNFAFQQAHHMVLKANELELGPYYNYYSKRSSEVMDIWSNVYGNTPTAPDLNGRYVRVLGTQSTFVGLSKSVVSFGNAFEHHDALAIAPYFGGKLGRLEAEVDLALTMTSSQLAQYLLNTELPTNKATMVAQKTIADTNGLRLIAYEAGQHLVAALKTHTIYGNLTADNSETGKDLTALFIATNREPLMKDIHIQYIKNWNEVSGGELIALFDAVRKPSKFGAWGLLEIGSQNITQSPKAMGVYESICGAL